MLKRYEKQESLAARESCIGRDPQCSRHVLMIRPGSFGFNVETAASNPFQARIEAGGPEVAAKAVAEFDTAVDLLDARGVRVWVMADQSPPRSPDAVFPNNWVSFHGDGAVVLYPLATAARRTERRREIVTELAVRGGFSVGRVIDLSYLEERGQYLEGTGSLVFDRPAGVAYAGLSGRTSRAALATFRRVTGFDVLGFETDAGRGEPVYHTNVMLSLGRDFAVLCVEAIAEAGDRRAVLSRIEEGGREIIVIDRDQMARFAGNLLEVETVDGRRVVVLSSAALGSLEPRQVAALERRAEIVEVRIPTIETVGGGGVRCMLAEVFLPCPAQSAVTHH